MEKGHKMPSDGAALKAKLAEFGLSFVGGWYSTELLRRSAKEEFEAARQHIAMTKGAGADIVIAAETSNCIHGDRSKPLSERPRLHRNEWAVYGAKMTEFAHRLADEGLKLCYHHHMGTIVQSERDIDAFMAHTKPPGAFSCSIQDTRVGRLRPRGSCARIPGAHRPCPLQGRARSQEQLRLTNAGDLELPPPPFLGMGSDLGVYTVPGDGVVDYAAVFEALKGYLAGSVLEAEQDPKKAPALPYAKKGVAHIRAALEEAGLN